MARSKGSVLIHVLVIAVITSIIAAGLLRMLLLRHTLISRAQEGSAAKKSAESAMARLVSSWNSVNIVCSNVSGSGYTCSPASTTSPGTCSCTCTSPGDATVVAALSGSLCQLTITSP
ncbi:MAG: hypothetical protein HY921_01095 [Elusimicrobia bacterium]|nr:hypothetical protein [Elusimicrobiota bacterium]